MNPALILFGIQSVIRLGRIGEDALEQYARDGEAVFPELKKPAFSRTTFVNKMFMGPEYESYVKGENAPYAEYWGLHGVIDAPGAVDALFTAAFKIKAEEGIDLSKYLNRSKSAGAVLIKQWDPGKAPLSPFARIIVAAGDIALEFVSANPGILSVSSNGEKLLGAFAGNLSKLLPDDGNFGTRHQFGERLLGAFLRAGLSAISDNPEWVISEDHMQKLISSAVTPVVDALPADITEQLQYREVAEALIGPAAGAVMQTVADHPEAFLGSNFDPENAIGALTRALLEEAAKEGLRDQFTKEGLIELYKAALDVAAQKPELFMDDNQEPRDQLARDLFSKCAAVLRGSPPPFDGMVGIKMAAAALAAVSNNAHRFAAADEAWEQTAADLVASLAGQFSKAFQQRRDLEKIFSKEQLVELGRVFLTHVAAAPGMIAGPHQALSEVVGAVAQAMARDDKLLLSGDDWIEIAKVASEEAAANPARLFRLDPDNPKEALAAQIMSVVLKSAGDIIDQPNMRAKTVLFGKTLREAVIVVLRAASGNPAAVQKNVRKVEDLVKQLNEFVAVNADHFGNKEWLGVFRILLPALLEGQELPELSVDTVNNLLVGGEV